MAACSGTRSGRAICWASALAASVVLAQATISLAAAEAQINVVGDVLEISMSGVPELRQRAAVNADGEIFLPLLGGIKVIGLPPRDSPAYPDEVGHRCGGSNAPSISMEMSRGRASSDTAWGSPFGRPSRWRAATTSCASGSSRDGVGGNTKLSGGVARGQAYVRRLQTELGARHTDADVRKALLAPSLVSEIAKLEAEQLNARETAHQREKAHFPRPIDMAGHQLSVLAEQQRRGLGGVAYGRIATRIVDGIHAVSRAISRTPCGYRAGHVAFLPAASRNRHPYSQ